MVVASLIENVKEFKILRLNLRETHRNELNEDRFLVLSWEKARRIAERFGWSVSEFVRSGIEKMMLEKNPALPEDLVSLYHGILKR
jgi:hypothetical protein